MSNSVAESGRFREILALMDVYPIADQAAEFIAYSRIFEGAPT